MGTRLANGAFDDEDRDRPKLLPTPQSVAGDPRKFSAYVLVPGHPSGKDRVFLGVLGYRPRSKEDAEALLNAYLAQARENVTRGEYRTGKFDRHGQRYAIEIKLKNRIVVSGWLMKPDGTLWLTTPFSGFAREGRERPT